MSFLGKLEPSNTPQRQLTEFSVNSHLRNEVKIECENSFMAFFIYGWHVVEGENELEGSWYFNLIAEHLEEFTTKEIVTLIINIPPRFLKSLFVSVFFPVWLWGPKNRPDLSFIFCTYASGLSLNLSLKRRILMQSLWFQSMWGDRVVFRADQNSMSEYTNQANGCMMTTSIGGTATGRGCDILSIDDPQDPTRAKSNAMRTTANEYVTGTLFSRFNNQKKRKFMLIMQRLHVEDCTGAIAEKFENTKNFYHLKIPIKGITRTIYSFPISGKQKVYEENEFLLESRIGDKEIESFKKILGEDQYAGQYEQEPYIRGGAIIKDHWWREYDFISSDLECRNRIISLDATFNGKETSDYVALGYLEQYGPNKYIKDVIRGKWSFVKTVEMIKMFISKYPDYWLILIEGKANGEGLADVLEQDHGISGIELYSPKIGKEERLHQVTSQWEGGNVWLPKDGPFVPELRKEFAQFPKGPNDDQVDCVVQALIKMVKDERTWNY